MKCETCSVEFPATTRGRPRRFCEGCRPKVRSFYVAGRNQQCATCGTAFWAHHKLARYCSPDCKAVATARIQKATSQRRCTKDQAERACACPGCTVRFTPVQGDLRQRFCGATCRARYHWMVKGHRRRVRKFGGHHDQIDPAQVFERDGWTCQLCNLQLHPEDRGTAKPEAPELDHVVPLARGGSHTWDNVQCACARCNRIKGAREPEATRKAA